MTLQHFIKPVLLFFLFSFPGYTQTLTQVHVDWNDEFLGNALKNITEKNFTVRGVQENAQYYRDKISTMLKDYGYFSVLSITDSISFSADSTSYKLDFEVFPGHRASVGNIYFSGIDSITSDYFNELKGLPFNRYEFEEVLLTIINRDERAGFPFGSIKIESIVYRDQVLDVFLIRKPGPSGLIQKIEIAGNIITEPEVIIRELRLKQNEMYTDVIIQKIPPRLNRLRLFAPVSSPGFYINKKNEGVLTLQVKENRFNNFDGIIGYIPPGDNNQPGYVTGLLNISFRNIFGTGRMTALRWQKVDRNTQELEIKYLEPWLFNYPLNITGALYQRKQDTTYVQLKFDFLADYLLNENVTLGWHIGTESIVPVKEDSLAKFTVYNSQYINSGVSARYDSRNDPLVPEYGIFFHSAFTLIQKKINGPAEFIFPGQKLSFLLRKVDTGVELFYSVVTKQVAALKLHFKAVSGDNTEINDMYKLGGNTNLRGYRENQFLASQLFLANTEYRFLAGGRTFVYPFIDAAWFKPFSADGIATPLTRIGYGAGIFLETGAGMLRVEYGLAKGDSFSKAKIHFGIVSDF